MDLAERLHMTISQLLANTDSRELALWMARDMERGKEQHKQNLIARAEAARTRR